LNNDLRVTPVGGEDAKICFQRHTLVGASRTYAYIGKEFSASQWFRAIRQGHTFFTTGPLIEFSVNQKIAGESVNLPAGGGTVTLAGRAWSSIPLTRMIIYHNGTIWKEIPFTGDRLTGEFHEQIKIDKSGWFSFVVEGAGQGRGEESAFPQAGTNAIRVYVGDQKIRSRQSAEYFIAWVDRLRGMTEKWPGWRSQAEKNHVYAQLDEARRIYQRLAAEAPQ
jgi:hypothetical protein